MNHRNELSEYLQQFCYDDVFNAIKKHSVVYKDTLDFAKEKVISYFDLSDVYFKYAVNVTIKESVVDFDSVWDAEYTYRTYRCRDYEYDSVNQWYVLHCKMSVSNRDVEFKIESIEQYSGVQINQLKNGAATNDLIPILRKEDFEREAEEFLAKWYPQALQKPMPIPIRSIVEKEMGLRVKDDVCITKDMSVFGQICFADSNIKVYNPKVDAYESVNVQQGTIMIDPNVFFLRSLGCANNTLAHEGYHWGKHRVYAIIHGLLNKAQAIAQRCAISPKGNVVRSQLSSGEDWMEWQANGVAPKILMPISTIKQKIEELVKEYHYAPYSENSNNIITQMITDLASFYEVSKQSAKIRMIELGYPEAAEVLNYGEENVFLSAEISPVEAFEIYSSNQTFRDLIELELFRNVEGFFVINSDKYRVKNERGEWTLTAYAKSNINECALKFEYNIATIYETNRANGVLYRRTPRPVTVYTPEYNEELVDKALEEVKVAEKEIEKVLALSEETVAQKLKKNMENKKWNSSIFQTKTGLSANHYSKINNNPNRKFELHILVSILVGLDLPHLTAVQLLEKAGHVLQPNIIEHNVYNHILSNAGMRNIYACNAFIEELNKKYPEANIRPLGAVNYGESA